MRGVVIDPKGGAAVAKKADIGSKRLIGLAPDTWARWLTGDAAVVTVELMSEEFEWVSRATDVLIKARSPQHGTFLIANEIQFRPDVRMPQRLRAYAALAEERYGLNVYPVVVNLLPPQAQDAVIADSYHSEFMGLIAHQDYKVVNLWDLDASLVLERPWPTLLPFVPVMKGGEKPATVSKALALLRADDQLAELETLLAFFATFVMPSAQVVNIMRWDMAIIRESPWYNEIVAEGLEKGMQQGMQRGMQQGMQQGIQQGIQQGLQEGRLEGQVEMLLLVLNRRFGSVSYDLMQRIRQHGSEQLRQLLDVALTAPSLEAVATTVTGLPIEPGNGHGYQYQTAPAN